MPLTVITLKKSPPSLRGDLTKWMQEISTGVYIGNFNSKIREELWKRVIDSVGIGEATMSFAYRNEIGYKFETHNSTKIPIDYDGIPLVLTPANKQIQNNEVKSGFSNAAKIRKAKKYSTNNSKLKKTIKEYVVLDLETTGLDPIHDKIIEIGALKISDKIVEYSNLVKLDEKLDSNIKKLTGIDNEMLKDGKTETMAIKELIDFIGNATIIGYNVNFDINFINEALKRQEKTKLNNKTYDVMKYVKQEKLFLQNYKLETVLKEYEINLPVPHRALEDAKLINALVEKIPELKNKLN